MESLLHQWDGEQVIIRFDRPTGAWIMIAIHSTCLGPSTGGTRMRSYPTVHTALSDALRLAAGMTYKFAVAGFPRGGGKAVIALPPEFDLDTKEDLLRRYGTLVHQLGGLFQTGPDVGTSPADMNVIAETGAPYVACRTPEKGGAGDSAPATAWGVFCGMQATCEQLYGSEALSGKRILVQGAGSVGKKLIELLLQAGAEVLLSDTNQEVVDSYKSEPGLEIVPAGRVYETGCDIFAPCALGGILNAATIPHLNCRAIAGAANNQLASPQDAERLRQRRILYAPDFVINIGGAMAITGIEEMGWTQADAYEKVAALRQTLHQVFARAEAENLTTDAAARRIAEERLAQAL